MHRHPPSSTRLWTAILVLLAACVAAAAPIQAATSMRAERVWVAGGDKGAWVVAAARASQSETPELWIWHAKLSPQDANRFLLPVSSRFLPPIIGDPEEIGADAAALRILFTKMSVWAYFPDREAAADTSWSDLSSQPPLAWAGDAEREEFWALAETRHLVEPRREAETQPATARSDKPAEKEIATTPSAEAARLTLLRLRRGFWNRIPVAIAETQGASSFWLSAYGGKGYLFWRSPDASVWMAILSRGNWSAPERFVRPEDMDAPKPGELLAGWAGATAEGPVFIAAGGQPGATSRLRVFTRGETGWRFAGAIREGPDRYLVADPKTAGVAVAGGRLAIARIGEHERVEFGWVDLALRGWVSFEPLAEPTDAFSPAVSWRQFIVLALAMGILTAVLFTRREQMNQPAAVPEGFVLAPVWRRVAAGMVDFAPAVLLVRNWFSRILQELGLSLMDLLEQLQENAILARILPVQVTALAIYGLWCLVWELASGTTLGKRIFDCRVLSAVGTAPNAQQILVRNIVRVLVLALEMPGILMTLMLMVMFTRNRQRLGDLLAGTIVVQTAPPEGEAPGEDI